MSTKLGTVIADFTTQLTTQLAIGGTTATLASATDDDGIALPAGIYFFTLDGSNSQKEHIVCTLNGTALTAISSVSRQGAQASGAVRLHRVGATVTLTDFAHLKYIVDLLDGTTNFDASDPLGYDGVATLTPGSNQFATVLYADGLAIAGSPKATDATYGLSKLSTAAVDVNIPISVGDNDTRMPTQGENDLLGKVLLGTDFYAASSAGTDTYAITLSPVPAYTNGIRFRFKADVANTGPATLNVNTLGAITLKKNHDQDLETGDIEANQIVEVVYNSTGPVFEMISQLANSGSVDIQTFTGNGTWAKPNGAKTVLVKMIAGGGGGGGGFANASAITSGGGGGGAYIEKVFGASDLGSTVSITVGAGGAGGAGSSGNGSPGSAGGTSSFGTHLYTYGGGGGTGDGISSIGGSGGGIGSAGSDRTPGFPGTTGEIGVGGGGGASVNFAVGKSATTGGGAGGGGSSSAPYAGGSSLFGGAGGGGGAGNTTGGAGGSKGITSGGGGAGGTTGNPPTAGTAGTAGNLLLNLAGQGGGGGGAMTANALNATGQGGAGGACGGGGGGGGSAGASGGTGASGGAGGRGEVVVITYF